MTVETSATFVCPRTSCPSRRVISQHSASFTVGGMTVSPNFTSAVQRLGRRHAGADLADPPLELLHDRDCEAADRPPEGNRFRDHVEGLAAMDRRITLRTAGEKGSTSRETIVCSSQTILAAVATGSIVACGIAACPPRPVTTMSNMSTEASRTPALPAIIPAGR